MHCPFCSAQDTKVTDSRLISEGAQVRRRRECAVCNERFTTHETAELAMPDVKKSSGVRQVFDEAKLRRGFEHALQKRPVSAQQLDASLRKIMHQLRTTGEREIESKAVGEMVMAELGSLDQVAYVRFASVYKSFTDVTAFSEEINKLTNKKN